MPNPRGTAQVRPAAKVTPVQPDARLVALVSYACEQVDGRLDGMLRDSCADWIAWAQAWAAGQRSPGACVATAQECFARAKKGPLYHTLGQLAWAAKEACYSTPTSPWLVIRYVADAMIAFGVAFPETTFGLLPSAEPARIMRTLPRTPDEHVG